MTHGYQNGISRSTDMMYRFGAISFQSMAALIPLNVTNKVFYCHHRHIQIFRTEINTPRNAGNLCLALQQIMAYILLLNLVPAIPIRCDQNETPFWDCTPIVNMQKSLFWESGFIV